MDIQTTQTFSDSPQSRPKDAPDTTTNTTTAASPKKGFSLPKNPKIIFLLILSVIILILLLLAAIVPKKRVSQPLAPPTPHLSPAPTPPQANNINLPPELKQAFSQLENDLNTPLVPINPPQIDLKVGKI